VAESNGGLLRKVWVEIYDNKKEVISLSLGISKNLIVVAVMESQISEALESYILATYLVQD
jgi:hypothetical protein